ncbi:MAG: hypothetical protein IJ504_01705 [Bacteroidales bacterium]|nr:hypothetical protein [Bacteroidales bacterium]
MKIQAVVACIFLLASCSVKEVRDSCPCLLLFDFSECGGAVPSDADLLVTSEEGVVWEDAVDLDVHTRYSVYVPKTDLHLRVWSGDGGLATVRGLDIPLGQDCPEIYMHDADVVATGEMLTDTVRMRKNHCVMHIKTEGGGDFPFDMKVNGNVSGYDHAGNPVEGKFECTPERDGDDFKVVLPRQTDDRLMLSVEGDGVASKTFALGQYLSAGGYDWSAPDLDDVSVTIDYALTEVRVLVNGWESVYAYDVIM